MTKYLGFNQTLIVTRNILCCSKQENDCLLVITVGRFWIYGIQGCYPRLAANCMFVVIVIVHNRLLSQ